MTILASELKLYRSAVVNDTNGSNGGVMSTVQVASGVANNLFPDVTEAERTAGITRYRKGFFKVANDADEALVSPRLFIPYLTAGDDLVVFYPTTQDSTQAATTASSPAQYGAGNLNADISSGASSLVVAVEDWSESEIFRIGDTIRISDQATYGGAGNEEFHTVLTVTPAVDLITLTLDGTTTANAFTAAATIVSSVYEPAASIEATADTYVETTASGTYDETTYPVEGDGIASIYDTWTLTFTSATAFDCVGSNTGAVGSGAIGSDFQPNNPDWTKPYFILRTAGWGGTWATNDTFEFTTYPAAQPLWFKQIVPAGATIASGNNFEIALDGQTA